MAALLGYPLISYAHNIIRTAYSRKPVRNNKGCAPFKQFGQSLLYKYFGAGINSAGCFVQNYNLGISKDYAGKGKQLALGRRSIKILA